MSALLWMCVACGYWNPTPAGEIETQGAFERVVEFFDETSSTSASGKGSLRDAEIRFALPKSGVGQQLVGGFEALDPGATLSLDRHLNRLASLTAPRLGVGDTLVARWRVRVVLADRIHHVHASALLPLTAVPPAIAGAYLGGGGKHSCDDPGLRTVAAEAAATATDPLDLAFRLNEAVRARLTYVRDGRWDDAATCWRTGEASCSEYHFVFATLARLAGLPCRFVGATAWRGAADADSAEDAVFHRWSEVWLPGYGWFPVDVSRNDGEDGKPVNAAFGKTSRSLLVLSHGDGDPHDPLGAAYVAERFNKRVGDGKAATSRKFVWTKPASAER